MDEVASHAWCSPVVGQELKLCKEEVATQQEFHASEEETVRP